MISILVIDSLRNIRNILKERLEYEGYKVQTTDNADEGIAMNSKSPFDIIICELSQYNLLKTDGAVNVWGNAPVIILSDDNTVEAVVSTMRAGAYDYLIKPIDMNRLRDSLSRAAKTSNEGIASSKPAIMRTTRKKNNAKGEMIGESHQINIVKNLIGKIAPSDARVLITGANGTGKELVAHYIHHKSGRNEGPFIEVNCAAIPSELIESELFGHEKGAFTSAIKQRKGKFEQAHGGTLFLDEIGDMSLSAQSKVLRALQENKISRVGSDTDIEVDVRVVAATNKNLMKEIEKGAFREDLYHRLSVITVFVPPLAERTGDIPILTNYFIETICAEYRIPKKDIAPEAVEELAQMKWSGNIRELRNVIERLIILSENCITLEDVKMYAIGIAI